MSDMYLAHHGVEGQKWGVQNGPPYPLDKAGQLRLKKQKAERKYEKARALSIKADIADVLNVGLTAATTGIGAVVGGPGGALAGLMIGTVASIPAAVISIGSKAVQDMKAIQIDNIGRALNSIEE